MAQAAFWVVLELDGAWRQEAEGKSRQGLGKETCCRSCSGPSGSQVVGLRIVMGAGAEDPCSETHQ